MKNVLLFLAVAALLFVVAMTRAIGQPAPECDPKDPTMCAVALDQGSVAPYSGQLLTHGLALRLGQKADRCDSVVDIERTYARRLVLVDLDLEKKLRENDARAHAEEMDLVRKELEIPWWERPAFVGPVAAVLGAGLVILAVWAAGQLR